MKNTIKLFGIIALVAVIGFSMAACGGGDDDDGGEDIGLDGVWKMNGTNFQVTVKGNKGVWASLPPTPDATTQSAITKGYIKIGGTFWRNLTSTDSLTYSGEQAMATVNSSDPDVAIGTSWGNRTFSLSADGQTLTVTAIGSSTATWKKQ